MLLHNGVGTLCTSELCNEREDSGRFCSLLSCLSHTFNQWYFECGVPEPGDAVAVDEIIAQIETDKVCYTALLAFKAVYHPIFAWQVIYTYSRGVGQIFMSKI